MVDTYLQTALKGKSESTRYTYATTLAKCLEITRCADSRALIMGRARTFDKLVATWPVVTTLKKALAMLCCITRANPDIAPQAARTYWLQRLEDASAAVKKKNSDNVASDALTAKWMEYDDILAKVEDVVASGDGHATLKESQELVVLAMFAYLPPKRADLGQVRIGGSLGMLANTENGMVVPADGGECKLVLNVYKTAKVYQQFLEALPEELAAIVRASLAAFPRSYLLVGPRDKPISDTNYSTRVTNVMDKYLGRRLSVNDLRHLYITQKIKLSEVTHEKRAIIAHSMMHSLEGQVDYIRIFPSL
jgi:hypothetical protein